MRAPLSHRLPHAQPRYGLVRHDACQKDKGSCGVVHNFAFSGVVFVISDTEQNRQTLLTPVTPIKICQTGKLLLKHKWHRQPKLQNPQ